MRFCMEARHTERQPMVNGMKRFLGSRSSSTVLCAFEVGCARRPMSTIRKLSQYRWGNSAGHVSSIRLCLVEDCTSAANPDGTSGREWCFVEARKLMFCHRIASLELIVARSRQRMLAHSNGTIACRSQITQKCVRVLGAPSQRRLTSSLMLWPLCRVCQRKPRGCQGS